MELTNRPRRLRGNGILRNFDKPAAVHRRCQQAYNSDYYYKNQNPFPHALFPSVRRPSLRFLHFFLFHRYEQRHFSMPLQLIKYSTYSPLPAICELLFCYFPDAPCGLFIR